MKILSDIKIGDVFTGWETDGILGSGPFGTVYLAHCLVENKPVYAAVKVVRTPPRQEAIDAAKKMGVSGDLLKTYFNKFKNDLNWELTMYGTVSSPNLVKPDAVTMQDAPEAGWTGYIRTPVYTPMNTYFEKVESGSEDAARLGAELCSALEALGEYGMVHGEIVPENVLVSDTGSFLLADYGVKRCLEKAGAGLFGLTASDYEAPELRSDEKKYTAASDIYALGILMSYVANNCQMPQNGEIANLDPKLAAIIRKATARNPEDRYASATLMREDIAKTELYANRRPQRRAVAAASAFDSVKKNGGTIRTEKPADSAAQPQEKFTVKGEEKIRYPNDVPEEKKSKKFLKKAAPVVIVAAAAVGLLWLALNNPFKQDENVTPDPVDKTPDYTIEETHGPAGTVDVPATNVSGDSEKTTEPENSGETEKQPEVTEPVQQPPETTGTEPVETTGGTETTPPEEQQPTEVTYTYILPSDTETITRADLEGFDKEKGLLAVNEIFARHGWVFKTAWIREYFEQQPWYKAGKSNDGIEDSLSAVEKANVRTIQAYLQEMGYR